MRKINTMKKAIALILLIFLVSFKLIGQVDNQAYGQTKNQSYTKQNTYKVVDYLGWQLSNDGCYGCPSFYWKVTKSVYPDTYGYYIYDFWFYSNSLYPQGGWASTYVYDIFIKVDGYWINSGAFWITFKEEYNPTMMRFKTVNKAPYINIQWGGQKVL